MAQLKRRTGAPLATTLIVGGALIAGALVVALGLYATGAFAATRLATVQPPGTVAVLVAPRALSAYTKITRDNVWDGAHFNVATMWVPVAHVHSGMAVAFADISGRVLNHDKPAGFVFTEDDFYPRGTRPGLSAGIPPGKRSLRVGVDKVSGFFGLEMGDRFDIVATTPVDPKLLETTASGAFKSYVNAEYGIRRQALVRVVAQNGVVVEPVKTRAAPLTATSLTQGAVTRTRPVQEIVIALEPGEIGPLMEALAIGADVNCIVHSGRSDDPGTSVVQDLQIKTPFGLQGSDGRYTFVDVVDEKGRNFESVPKAPGATKQ